MTRSLLSVILLLSFLLPQHLMAQRPVTIPYQGTIADANGAPFSGNYDMAFELKDQAGTSLWASGTITVPVNLGAYSVELGTAPQTFLSPTIWKQNDSIFLHISFDDGVNGLETLAPAVRMLPVPFAIVALYADSLCADSLRLTTVRTDSVFSFYTRTDTIYTQHIVIQQSQVMCGNIKLKGGIKDSMDTHKLEVTDQGVKIDGPDNDPDTRQFLKEAERVMEDLQKKMSEGLTTEGGEIKVEDKTTGNEVKIEMDVIDSIMRLFTGKIIILPDPFSDEKAEIDEEGVALEDALRRFEQVITGNGGEIVATDKTNGMEVKVNLDAVDKIIEALGGPLVVLPNPFQQDEKGTLSAEEMMLEDAIREMKAALTATGGELIATDKTNGMEVKVQLDAVNKAVSMIGGPIIVLPDPTKPNEKSTVDHDGLDMEGDNGDAEFSYDDTERTVGVGVTDGVNSVTQLYDADDRVIVSTGAVSHQLDNGQGTASELFLDPVNIGVVVQSFDDLIGANSIVCQYDASAGSVVRSGVATDITQDDSGMSSVNEFDPINRAMTFLVMDDNTTQQVGMAFLPNTQTIDIFANVNIQGNISKLGGTFRIDHPLDKENKYLYHSFVESPDMMNIYNGNTTTDSSGVAVVEMPDYFQALNMEFRYQLTVIGDMAQAVVYKELADNQFEIMTDKPGVKVSWQITGVRQDDYAQDNRMEVEVEKEPEMKGTLLYNRAQ